MHLESGSGLYVEEKEERLLKPEIAGDTKDKASSLQNWNKKHIDSVHRDCERMHHLCTMFSLKRIPRLIKGNGNKAPLLAKILFVSDF